MTIEAYRPNHLSIHESRESIQSFNELVGKMVVSDNTLEQYINEYFAAYRATVDEFFPQLAGSLPKYANAPFHTFVVRMGPIGVIIGSRSSDSWAVEIRQFEDFDPPFSSANIREIAERLSFAHCYFSFTPRTFDVSEARSQAVEDALSAVLEIFWLSISNKTFQIVARKLIFAEGLSFDEGEGVKIEGTQYILDAKAHILLNEPGGYRRFEDWAFEFCGVRVSANKIRQVEDYLKADPSLDCLCLVTSDDLTSVSDFVASKNSRIRVWDRSILKGLIYKHPNVLRSHFDQFPDAVEELSKRLETRQSYVNPSAGEQLASRLGQCPTGRDHFAEFERIGIEVFSFLFAEHLGPAKPQTLTLDEKQRRDVLYRNNRTSRFFDRCFHRFVADTFIVDFKNYGEEIESKTINDVSKYANDVLGRLIWVVSRKGLASSAIETQHRVYRNSKTLVLVLNDQDLLEMMKRKEDGLIPEDVIEDKLDEFVRSY